MCKIKSFQRNHNEIEPGVYLQERRRMYNNSYLETYDLRFVKPNTEVVPIEAIHSIEHLFATYLKNTFPATIVSFNPGGCQTMFYLEIINSMPSGLGPYPIKALLIGCINWCLKRRKVPGATKEECGNYKSHDLLLAQAWLKRYKEILENE